MNYLSTRLGPIVVSVIVAVMFGIVLNIILTKAGGVPDTQLITLMCGVLAAKFGDVVNYWVGSSSGSKAKDENQATMAASQAQIASLLDQLRPTDKPQ